MSLATIVSCLGIAQIISWGTLYYSISVLALPIRAELGASEVTIFGAFTIGLLVSGVAAPLVGKRVDTEGGRRVMSIGSAIAAMCFLVLAVAREPIMFCLGWILGGIAMAACLYDPAFASLHQIAGERYRRAVTGLTLFGGFASSVFWPLSNALSSALGWRYAFAVFALLHLAVCLPIHLRVLPGASTTPPMHASAPSAPSYLRDRRFYWLAASFACITFVFSSLSAFIIAALTTRGFAMGQAVWIAALVGPMQVLARVIEWLFAGRIPAVKIGVAACALSLIAMVLLNVIPGVLICGLLFAICYGASNGIITIARGTVPAELFGPQRQGALLGGLARPSFLTKAFAPALFAAGLSAGLSMQTNLLVLVGVSAAALVCFVQATRGQAHKAEAVGSGGTALEKSSAPESRTPSV